MIKIPKNFTQEVVPVTRQRKIWRVPLIVLAILLLIFFIIFASLTFVYWNKIKNGETDIFILNRNIFLSEGAFTQSLQENINNAQTDFTRTELEISEAPYIGNPNAEIVIVEFMDFKCANCLAASPIMDKVLAKYGNKIKLIVRDYPSESLHPGSTELAKIGYCAHRQGRFWKMQDVLFANQDILPEDIGITDLKYLAREAGIGYTDLQKCLDGGESEQAVKRDYLDGYRFGVRGTPTFFINGEKVEGVIPFEAWNEFLSDF